MAGHSAVLIRQQCDWPATAAKNQRSARKRRAARSRRGAGVRPTDPLRLTSNGCVNLLRFRANEGWAPRTPVRWASAGTACGIVIEYPIDAALPPRAGRTTVPMHDTTPVRTMLMITIENEAAGVTLRLDGRLAGPEARELTRYRSSAAFEQLRQAVALDLTGVVAVDHEGRDFLAQAHRRGDRLVGGVTTRAIVDEILASPAPDHGQDGESGTLHDDWFRSRHGLFNPSS
jgi:anti-anti-sigma regulatory factor